jgi:hypothetical protein
MSGESRRRRPVWRGQGPYANLMARQAVRLRPHDCRLFLRASGRLAGGRVVPREQRMYLAPSSSGPGRRPLKAVAPVQIRSGLLEQQQVEGLIVECGGRALIICPSPCTWLVTSLFGDIAAALSEDGSAALDDEHCCYYRRPDWSAVTAICTVAASRAAR